VTTDDHLTALICGASQNPFTPALTVLFKDLPLFLLPRPDQALEVRLEGCALDPHEVVEGYVQFWHISPACEEAFLMLAWG